MNEENTLFAVALGRIEEVLKGVNEKLDMLVEKSNAHHATLSKREAGLAVLESKSGSWRTAVAVLLPIIAGADLIFSVANQL